MNKFILSVIASLMALSALAQIPKGTIMAGASSNLGLGHYNSESFKTTNFSFTGKGGYFFMDNWVGGLNLGFSANKSPNYRWTSTSLGLYSRYYIKGKVFVGGEYGVQFGKSKTPTETNKGSDNYGTLSAGYAAFLTPNIAVEPMLTHNVVSGGGFNLNLNIGFTLFFNRDKKP